MASFHKKLCIKNKGMEQGTDCDNARGVLWLFLDSIPNWKTLLVYIKYTYKGKGDTLVTGSNY